MALINGMSGYNNTVGQALGESTGQLPVGNYICKILNVRVEHSKKTYRPMFVIQFDIAEGEFAGYYKKQYDALKEKGFEAKYKGVYYQLMDGTSLAYYKGLLETLERCNSGLKLDGEAGFDSQILKGKVFGGRFGEEEYLNNSNETKTITKLRYIIDTEKLKTADILPVKKLKVDNSPNDFYSIEDGIDDDNLPF